NGDCTTEMCACTWKACKVRQCIESEIHFPGRPAKFIPAYILDEIPRKILGAHKFHKCEPGVDTRRDNLRPNLISIFECDAFHLPVLNQNPGNPSFCANLCPCFSGGPGNCIRNRTGAAAYQPP